MTGVADIRRMLVDAGADVTSLELAEFLWLTSRLPAPEARDDVDVTEREEEPLPSDKEDVDDGIRTAAERESCDDKFGSTGSASLGRDGRSSESPSDRAPRRVETVVDIGAGLDRRYDYLRTIRRFARTSEAGAAVVDVRASAEASARARAPIIVSRRRARAVTRLLILEDQAPQLAPWRRAFDEIARLAHESNTFDEVSRGFIRLVDPAEASIVLRSGAPFDVNTFERAGRDHVVLLLSDALGAGVDSGALGRSLAQFPEGTRIAWANPWSSDRWRRSRLAKLRRVRPNPLAIDADWVPTAMAEFDPEGLQQLAEWLAGFRVPSLAGWRLPSRMPANVSTLRVPAEERDWFEHLRRISAAVSPAALRLLGLAAAIPGDVDVDLLLRLGSEFSTKPSRLDVAEAITTGLLTTNAGENGDTNVVLSFRSIEARRAALGLLERRELDRVLRWLVQSLDEPAGRERARRLRFPVALMLRATHHDATAAPLASEMVTPDAESIWTTIFGTTPTTDRPPVSVGLTDTPVKGKTRMAPLPPPLRRQLERAVTAAREIATLGAQKALKALAVHEPDPYRHMNDEQRNLRRRLRAQARQLGDEESKTKRGVYSVEHLVEKIAYDQWHRLLFARFLFENDLLISPDHGVSASFHDCEEFAPALGLKDGWEVAARFAAKELPEIFRADDPAGELVLPVEERNPLIGLVKALPLEVFTASDSIGWCYQFWQAEKKDEVNASGVKIGAEELPAVTQLFTEDYMVDFLLDNTLGAWWAGKVLAANPDLARNAANEEELRNACALPHVPWSYLRFIREPGEQSPEEPRNRGTEEPSPWRPAAGTFPGWPKDAKEITCLDPCMGSGHFVVSMLERMVALRTREEGLNERDAVAAAIRDNIYGLEIDARCTQIAAFNIAFSAWRRGGYQQLPQLKVACSGLAPNASEAEWVALAGKNQRLRAGMERIYRLFADAPVLGSLIEPRAQAGNLLESGFRDLQALLAAAASNEDENTSARAVTASGIALAVEVLASESTLVATNVPYLGRGKQDEKLKTYCDRVFPDGKADLATAFLERCLRFCSMSGTVALVLPQNWLYQNAYKPLRIRLLREMRWHSVAQLGEHGFDSAQAAGAFVAMNVISNRRPSHDSVFAGFDAISPDTPAEKAKRLSDSDPQVLSQRQQLANPDSRVMLGGGSGPRKLLSEYASSFQGIKSGDDGRVVRKWWELASVSDDWRFYQSTTLETRLVGGLESVIWWKDKGAGLARRQGVSAWGRRGVMISQMRSLPAALYFGDVFDSNASPIVADDEAVLTALWAFCSSDDYAAEVRRVDQSLKPTNTSLVSVPFDAVKWRRLAVSSFPDGFPEPVSDDPTQWVATGRPLDSAEPLQVGVARLLGYLWPRQTGSQFSYCPRTVSDELHSLADADGIVPISATKGERSAADRLRELLARSFGKEWGTSKEQELLEEVGYGGKTLDDWMRNGFFEQHCALFHTRPFIWQIWDGHRNGFSALVNYHNLTQANLESLTYSYLGDWIRRQQAAVEVGEAGSDARLEAAKELQEALKLILEGEPPYDIFVRWKPLSQQRIGWCPELNDGVRVNIRPFITAGVLRRRVNVNWNKDRGKEPLREKKEYPWLWGWDEETEDFRGGADFDGNRWNDLHYSIAMKKRARGERA